MKKAVNLLCVLSFHRGKDWWAFQSAHVRQDRLQRYSSESKLHFLWILRSSGLVSDALLRNLKRKAWPRLTEQRERGFIWREQSLCYLYSQSWGMVEAGFLLNSNQGRRISGGHSVSLKGILWNRKAIVTSV